MTDGQRTNPMLKSSLCDYSDGYILVKKATTVLNTAAATYHPNNRKRLLLKTVQHLLIRIVEINNTQVDNDKEIDIVTPIHNLIEYSDNYSKTSGSL